MLGVAEVEGEEADKSGAGNEDDGGETGVYEREVGEDNEGMVGEEDTVRLGREEHMGVGREGGRRV
jgi:hypothetical protein